MLDTTFNVCDSYCNAQSAIGYNAGLTSGLSQLNTAVEVLFAVMIIQLAMRILIVRLSKKEDIDNKYTRIIRIAKEVNNGLFYTALLLTIYLFMWTVLGFTGIEIAGVY